MANPSRNAIAATITATDVNNNVPVTRGIGPLSWDGSTGMFQLNTKLAGGANVISLPITPVLQLMVRNADAANDVTVTWTPNGGAGATIILLKPGAVICFWELTAAGGITALTLTPSVAATPVDIFIGG